MTNSTTGAVTPNIDPASKPSDSTVLLFQVINVSAFVICIIMQKLHEKCAVTNLRDMNMKWDIKFHPAPYAFAIWGIIYLLLTVFVVYQALPASMAPHRNDEFIYVQVGYWFLANMILNGLWLIVFVRDNKWTHLLSEVINLALLATCLRIMMLSCRAELTTFEAIIIRTGFSLYSGWVTAANVLNIFFVIKSWKSPSVEDDEYTAIKEEADKGETSLAVKALYIVFVIYAAISIEELNPAYGIVLLWVYRAIQVGQDKIPSITNTAGLLLKIYGVLWFGIVGYSVYEKTQGTKRGLFY